MVGEITAPVAEWFLEERGIRPETLDYFGVTVRDDGAVVLPYANGEKVRKGIPHGEREFFFTAGKKPDLFNSQDANKKQCFLVEGETDTMRLWQEAGSDAVGVLGLSGIEAWRDEYAEAFRDTEKVYVILDNDKDYNVVARVDNAFREIRSSLRGKVQRVKLPRDVKDICEFFTYYDLETLRLLCARKGLNESRYKLLDLTAEPPPVSWLVHGMLCRGDLTLFLGEPGIGKSWLTMDLAAAVAAGKSEWLGHPLMVNGPERVLYLDEENPEDLIFDRMTKLGMTRDTAKNIRYLNNLGIRLDKDADDLIDEALDFEPSLIVMDALADLHSEDEDKSGPMSTLFNDAFKPLARETGAAVILIHHANKTDSNSSYKRSRGSGAIVAGPDAGFDIRQVGLNQLTIANFKSRRQKMGGVTNITIRDLPSGGVELVGGPAPEPLF